MLKCMCDAHTYKANDCAVLCLVAQLCLNLFDPMDSSVLPGSSVHGNSPGKNIGVGCHALFLGIFPTQRLNPSFLHCRRILYQLSYQGSPGQWLTLINFQSSLALSQLLPSGSSTFNHMVKKWSAGLCKNSCEVWLGLLIGFFTS